MHTVHSFDVFDTCLTRTYALPTDVFAAAALRLRTQASASFDLKDLHDVVRLRTSAETLARAALLGREDLTLADICARLPANPWGVAPTDFLEAELQAEASGLRPVARIRADIEALRRAGKRIIFVTDMYLPSDFIREQLEAHGFYRPGDGLYVSGEIGLCKWSGRLYRHVLEQEGVPGRMVLHTGDNPAADGRMARRAGLATRAFSEAALTSRERALAAPLPGQNLCASLLAGCARAVRTGDSWPKAGLAAVAASVAAPLFLVFTAWALREAGQRGVSRLHFVSRDGQIFYRMARILRQANPGLPEPVYVHGSRQAWFLPALPRCAREHLSWLVVPGHSRRPDALLAKLGMRPADLPRLDARQAPHAPFWTTPLPPGGEDAFWELLERPDNALAVERGARRARKLAAAYFRPLAKDLPSFDVVDLGWTLKAQGALGQVLRESGIPAEVFGYYFGVSAARTTGLEGRYRAFLVESPRHLDPAETLNPIFRNANLLEQCFSLADHGQVIGYAETDQGAVPSMRPLAPGQEELAHGVQDAILAVTRAYAEQAHACGLDLEELAACKPAVVANALAFLSDPQAWEARALKDVSVGDDQNESRRRKLARPLFPADLWRGLAARALGLGPMDYARSFDWLEGSVALSPAWLRPLLRQPRVFGLLREMRIRC